ncbi:2OG-Fe(II) oxygenase [Podospora appendiculata]|uniref:2OG-Fe(II) oxygenase n=1 Tax=Podospora appendiculata TaxID=314037 RepID=A0AAE0WZ06_9PEZI|nr:2OG-Fe(II) oxygenase [Podospora appendiculata]
MGQQAPASNFTEIPIINLALASGSSSPADRESCLTQLRHALTNVGFLYIVNHGVPETAISNVVEILPRLFAMPDEAKDEVALGNSPQFLGFSGNGAETTAGRRDRREQFEFATELGEVWDDAAGGVPLYERLRGPNQWPSGYPEIRPVVETYIHELTLLGERFLRLVAEALFLPPETFFSFLSEQHRLKLVHYPATDNETDSDSEQRQGVGPHKDSSGWWTFLLQASPPHVRGLQALNKQGAWVDVPNIAGSFVVNIGQAFEVVTNGVCKATTHRVVLAGPESERFSVPFFQGVRRDLTRGKAVGSLKGHFESWSTGPGGDGLHAHQPQLETEREIDSPFLKGKYDTWGESQLRTKIRSHRDVGRKFYGQVFEEYVNDD